MNIHEFRRSHETSWRELEQAVKEPRQLFHSGVDFTSFAMLYRKVSGDLAYAQTYFPDEKVTAYLNSLIASAHNRLYRGGESGFHHVGHFFVAGFPQVFRALRGYVLIAALVTLAAALFGFIMTYTHPIESYHLLPTSLLNQLQPTQTGPHAVDAPLLASIIMTHNILVTLEAFVGGITFGLFTLYTLWNNGIIIGVLAGLFAASHRSLIFWSLIVPHGVTELLAIFIAGGAGFLFGHRLLAPGIYRRGAALQKALVQAVQLMLGVVPMLVIAGTLEGFVTPSYLPVAVKFAVAVVSAIFWLLYFSVFGRRLPKQSQRELLPPA